MKRRILAIILACFFAASQTTGTLAVSPQNEFSDEFIQAEASSLVELALRQEIVPSQERFPIQSLYLADSIPIYEVTANQAIVEVSDMKYYPILDQDNVVRGMIIARMQNADNTVTCEYNTLFCDELTAYKQDSADICFIFDQTDIYIYNGTALSSVYQNKIMPDESRGIFTTEKTRSNQVLNLNLKNINSVSELDISYQMTARSYREGYLNVPRIAQTDWENGCWAASAVCVGNYLSSTVTRTLDDIMTEYAGGEDVAKSILTVQEVLADEYEIETNQHLLSSPTMSTVLSNIGVGEDRGTPIIGRVSYDGLKSGHFIVIRGYMYNSDPASNNRVTIMDSLSAGSYRVLATSGAGETATIVYTSPSSGNAYDVGMYLTIS